MDFMKFLLLLLLLSRVSYAWDLKELGQEVSVPVTHAPEITLYGAGLTGLVLIFEDEIEDPVQESANRKRPLGHYSKFGDLVGLGYPNVLYILGQSVVGVTGNDQGYNRALGMLKATVYAGAVTKILKMTVREPRPDNHNDRDAFPSSHATMAFSFSGYVFGEHGWQWGIPAIGLSLFSGFSRINDNRHNLHDVLAGATIGFAYGLGMSRYQKKKELAYMIVPVVDGQTRGLAFVKDF